MTNIENIKNTKASHLFVAFSPSLQSLSSLSSFSSGQKSFKNLRPHFFNFLVKQALIRRVLRLFMRYALRIDNIYRLKTCSSGCGGSISKKDKKH